jgi:hypothetical protein
VAAGAAALDGSVPSSTRTTFAEGMEASSSISSARSAVTLSAFERQ